MSMLQFTILGSGSSGNCAYIETPRARILVDAGFSGREIGKRLAEIGRSIDDIQAVLVTHEHTDHVQGLNVLCNRHDIPLYINRLTREAVEPKLNGYKNYRVFATGSPFEIGDIHVENFSVPHDAYDPVGFLFSHGRHRIGFLTDLGYATRLVIERVRQANVLVLEANHDMKLMQADTKRPWAVKQRILSRHGHLSNEAAAGLAREIVTDNLHRLYLGHLSRDCNEPGLARAAVAGALHDIGAAHVALEVTSQDRRCETLVLDGAADAGGGSLSAEEPATGLSQTSRCR
ncbi:MAG: MBL fold metallo-hydrolase [Verrucomicrobiae bacterium]|nr:MBL fold metallo-hydrolase [Verrucomicrobiae bacterium]